MDQPLPAPMPQTPPPPVNKAARSSWLTAGGVILMGIVALMMIRSLTRTPAAPTALPEETPTPTRAPVRILSSIATQSAFIVLEQTHASLSATLTATNLDDPSLSPPVLTLPLGFQQ